MSLKFTNKRVVTPAHRRARRVGAAALSALVAPLMCLAGDCPEVDPAAMQLLDRMNGSIGLVSYHGVVTFQRDGEDMQVMQVTHGVGDDSSSESMTQLTGQGAQVVRDNHPLNCVHPGARLLHLSESMHAGDCGVAENYRFRVADGERVAGRKSVRLVVTPRDLYRYGYVMELDSKTGLLLKSETIGRGDRVLEKYQFADIAYNKHMPKGGDVSLVHQADHPLPGAVTTATRSLERPWMVNWLPRGFTATDTPPPNAGRRTYTDGLSVFSVFLESPGKAIRPGEGMVREGSTTSYTRGMAVDGEPVLVTIVGEVPLNTARMVADSIRWMN